jgi:dihydrofolate reductase
MMITLIVAAAQNNAIGRNNQLLWHLPNDMKFFKSTTWAMPVVMGRKTFASLGDKPLPGRHNIVISRDASFKAKGITVVGSPEKAIAAAEATYCREAFIIGGGLIYEALLPQAHTVLLTRVQAVLEGDVFFPELQPEQWQLASELTFQKDEKHAYDYSFQKWVRGV